MKILFIHTLYKDPRRARSGGGKLSVGLLAAALRKHGHEVAIFTTRRVVRGDSPQAETLSRAVALIPDNVFRLGTKLTDCLLARAITRLIRSVRPDVIHAQDDYVIPALVRADLGDIPVVATMRQPVDLKTVYNRGWLPGVAYLYRKRLKLRMNCLKKVGAVIAISDFIRKRLSDAGVEAVTIYNLPPPWPYAPLEDRRSEVVRIISPGRITVYKGFATLLRAAKAVFEDVDNFELLIIGDGPYVPSLRNLIGEYGLGDRVRLLAGIEYRNMKEVYRDSDIVIFPTESSFPEALGRISIEGMVTGRPVIASRNGAIPEIVVDGETGILFTPGDYRELAAAMIRLIQDRTTRIEMGKKGREVISRILDPERIVERHLDIYRRAIEDCGNYPLKNH